MTANTTTVSVRQPRAGSARAAAPSPCAHTRRRLVTHCVLGAPAILAGSTLLATACATSSGSKAAGGAAGQHPALRANVTVSFLQTSGQAEQALVNQVVERWRQAHPGGPNAELIVSTGDVVEKFSAMAAAGTPPALVSMDASQGLPFVNRGDMSSLDDFVKRDRYDLGDYIPASLDQYRWKGKLYALLRDFSHQSLWINTDLFQKEGIAVPAGDYASTGGGWDFDRFVEAVRRLTKPGPTPTRASQYGCFLTTGLRGGYGQWVWANGAELFDKDFKKCTADDERVVAGLQFMQDLLYRHRVAPDDAALAELKAAGVQTGAQQQFFDDTVALAFLPVARIGEARQSAKGNWDLVVAPQGNGAQGKRLTSGGGVGWYLVRGSPYQEEGWALLAHFTSVETHKLLADVRIPGRKSVLDWWLSQSPNDPPKSRNVARTGQEHVHINPVFPLWDRLDREVFGPHLARLWQNKATARDVTRDIVSQANRIIAESPA